MKSEMLVAQDSAPEATQPVGVTYVAFDGPRCLLSGPLHEAVLAIKRAEENGASGALLIFDSTGRVVDVDTRGTTEEVAARFAPSATAEPRPRGRPKLGVVAREVTLLPRHWDWLATQPGGASVALRKLVEVARRSSGDADRQREARESAYRFLAAIAGDFQHFEEAARALFAGDESRFTEIIAEWPEDVRDHAVQLAFREGGAEGES
jgi:hypothetical protein